MAGKFCRDEYADFIVEPRKYSAKIISQEMEAYAPLLTQPVSEALVKLYASDPQTGARLVRRQECSLADFVADAYKTVLDCDVALVNGGSVRRLF